MKAKVLGVCAALVWSLSMTGTSVAQESRDYKTAMEECFWGLILPREDQRGLSLGLNVVSGALGLYAYSSATSTPDTFCAEKTAGTAMFIHDAYPELIEDTARGEGQHLVAALELAGCDARGQAAAIPLIRQDMAAAVSSPNYHSSNYTDKVFTMYQSVNLRSSQVCSVG